MWPLPGESLAMSIPRFTTSEDGEEWSGADGADAVDESADGKHENADAEYGEYDAEYAGDQRHSVDP